MPAVDRDRSRVGVAVHTLDARRGACRKKPEHRGPVVGRAIREVKTIASNLGSRRRPGETPQLCRGSVKRPAHLAVESADAAESRGRRDLSAREARLVEQLLGEMRAASQRHLEGCCSQVLGKQAAQMTCDVRPTRSLSPSTPVSSSTPSPIRPSARETTPDVPDHAGVPGDASGRQRKHGRKPAASAAAAVGK